MQVTLLENYITFIYFCIKTLSPNLIKIDKREQKQALKPRRLIYLAS